MNSTPAKGIRATMIEEIQAEIARQPAPAEFDADTIDQLTKAVVDALLGFSSLTPRYPTERKAAESIVLKLQQLVK